VTRATALAQALPPHSVATAAPRRHAHLPMHPQEPSISGLWRDRSAGSNACLPRLAGWAARCTHCRPARRCKGGPRPSQAAPKRRRESSGRMNWRALASGSPWLMSQACGARCNVQSTRHRIQYLAFGAIMSSKSGKTRQKCGRAAKSHAPLCKAPPRFIIVGLDWSQHGQLVLLLFISRYSPYSQCACNVGSRTQLSSPLACQGDASCNCWKFHIDKFFCDRHTIVAAASHFPPTRQFVERAANAARAGEQAHKASLSSNHAHRITLAWASNQAACPANMLTVQPVLLDRKRGVYRDNIATSSGCTSHRDRLGNLRP